MGWTNDQFIGQLVIPTGATTGSRIEINVGNSGEIQVFDAGNNLVARVMLVTSGYGGGGFWARGFQFPENIYSALVGGELTFGTVDTSETDLEASIAYSGGGANELATLDITTGRVVAGRTEATIQMRSESTLNARPFVTNTCDTDIQGVLTADSIAFGAVTITPVAGTPTSITVSGLSVAGTTFRGYATANTTVIGSQVLGVAVSSVTSSSLLVWVYRTNATNSVVNWQVLGV